jgi:hypothetical protein
LIENRANVGTVTGETPMKRSSFRLLAAAGTLIVIAACSESSTSPTQSIASQELTAAFLSTPAGFNSTENSFNSSSDDGEPWMPDRNAHDDGNMMGGGMGPAFFGGVAFGRGFDHGPFGFGYFLFNCSFSSTTGRVTCEDVTTRKGLTISRSFGFWDATGAVQPFPNDKTDKINVKVDVSGTVVRHDKRDTSTVAHNSDRTVGGLAPGATQRTVDGTSKGTESTVGTTEDGTKFTATRLVTDEVKGLIIPLQDNHPTFPTAGTITRTMQATLTLGTAAPVTRSRTEVVTFDGSSTAKVVITKNGTTKNCTLPLPFGRLKCS